VSKCRFKVGDQVKWTSQSGGHSKTKVGEVTLVLDDGRSVPFNCSSLKDKKRRFDNFEAKPGRRVLVEVKPGPKARPRVYRPYEVHLVKVRKISE